MGDVIANIVGIVVFIGLIFLSIGLHEFGHFAAAKHYGVKVTEFMIGFGPALWSRVRGETRYGVKTVPVGGYVRIVGMYPPGRTDRPAPTGRFGQLIDEAREASLAEIGPGDENRVFYRLPVRQRIVVMMAGPFMNLFLAIVLFGIMLVGIGLPTPTSSLAGVVECVPTVSNPDGAATAGTCPDDGPRTAAIAAGLRPGDRIVSVDGNPISSWEDVSSSLAAASGSTTVVVDRGGTQIPVTVDLSPVTYPVYDDQGQPTGATIQRTFLGVRPQVDYVGLPVSAVPGYMWDITTMSVGALLTMPQRMYDLGVTLATDGQRSQESPVSVVGVTRLGGEIAATDEPVDAKIGSFLGLAASLNLFLFLFNLLPILPLDGGHVAAALYEGARRKWASWRDRPDPGPVDTARLLPLTYSVAVILIAAGAVVIWADLVKPITLGG
ncbi:MAG: site-2 protease family protein [Candidatus Nanopelagicales bacterium]